MNRMNKLRGVVAAAAISMGGAAAQAAEDFTIALVPGLTTDAFYITMNKGAEAAAELLGLNLVFQGAPDFNPTTQVPVLDAVIARKPDAILIAPTDRTQLIEPMRKAEEAGIPLFTVDQYIGDGLYRDGQGDGDFPWSFIASDNTLGGRLAGRAMGEALGGKGKVYVSNIKPGISATDQREAGFKMELQENYPNIEILNTQFNDNDANKSASHLQAVFARNPDLKGVFGANLDSALGAANGVQQIGKTGDIKVIAFDAPASIVNNIETGLIDAAIAQHPFEIGYYAVLTAHAHLTGNSVPAAIKTGLTVIDATNVDDPEVNRFIYSN